MADRAIAVQHGGRLELVATIGLEVHAQLRTATKMFCGCPVLGDAPPNSAVCPVCLGLPGTLPRPNAQAIALALRAGAALGCEVHVDSVFARKHYFYPDLPKGYQISQYDRPLCTDGALHVVLGAERRAFHLVRVHVEEDAGRMHHGAQGSLLDWNRAGVPLIEIVGAPDLRTPEEAEAWMRMLHRVLVDAQICTGDLEKGHFRCDANVSVAPPGAPPGTRVELKNINSFRFVARALRYEIERQQRLIREGGAVESETRTWAGKATVSLRKKEGSADYRYLPDPDLPTLEISAAEIAAAAASLPGAPLDLWLLDADQARVVDFRARTGLGQAEAGVILADPEVAAYYDRCLVAGGEPRSIATWVMGELMRVLKDSEAGLAGVLLTPENLVSLDQLVSRGTIPRSTGRALFEELCRSGADPVALVAERGLGGLADTELLRAHAAEVVAAHPVERARYREGKRNLLAFFVGQLLRRVGGKADPRLAAQVLEAALEAP